MKDINGEITYKGKTYNFVFNLNVMEAIQDEYGTIDHWGELTDGGADGEPNAKALIFGMTEMLNEGIMIDNDNATSEADLKNLLTRRQVGRMLTEIGLKGVTKVMNETILDSTKGESKNE